MLTYGGTSLRELIHVRYAQSCVKKEASGKKQDKQGPTKHHTVSLSTMVTGKKNERTQKAAVLASIGKEQRAGKTGLTLLQGTSSRKMRDTHVRREHNTCICI